MRSFLFLVLCAVVFSATGANCNQLQSISFNTAPSYCKDSTVTFTNTSFLKNGWTFFWDYGDGTKDTALNGSHVYHAEGAYTVKLRGDIGDSCVYTVSRTISVIICDDSTVYIMGSAGSPTTCHGYFYDNGGPNGNYSGGGQTTFRAPAGQQVRVTFEYFSTEAHWDVMYVYDGNDFIGSYSGSIPKVFTSTKGSLKFSFDCDFGVYSSGWKAKVSCVNPANGPDILMSSSTDSVCTGTFYDKGGLNGNYGNNENFTKVLTSASTNEISEVYFNSFDLDSLGDTLYVYSGSVAPANLIGAYTGTNSPGFVRGYPLRFVFVSDSANTGAGWVATLSCSYGKSILIGNKKDTVCSAAFYDVAGPGGWYYNSSRKQTFVAATPGQQIKASFGYFDTYSGDYLYVYDGPDTNSARLIGRFSGTNTPGPFLSTLGSLTFYFKATGNSLGDEGWSAGISCSDGMVDSLNMKNDTVVTCGRKFYDTGGPDFSYRLGERLTQTYIAATPGNQLQVDFTYFNIAGDTMLIYDGPNTSAPLIGYFRGGNFPPLITSTTGSLTFRFASNNSVSKGWQADIYCVSGPGCHVCTPATQVTAPGLYPLNSNDIPCAFKDSAYVTVLTFKNYDSLTLGGVTLYVDSMVIDTLNLPCGMYWVTNRTLGNGYAAGETGCIRIMGKAILYTGQFNVKMIMRLYANGQTTPISITSDSLGIKTWIRVMDYTHPCVAVDTTITAISNCRAPGAFKNLNNEFTVCRSGNTINVYPAIAHGVIRPPAYSSYSYMWAPSTNLNCTRCDNPYFATNVAGTYVYTVTFTDGFTIFNDTVTIKAYENTTPAVTITASPNPPCAGQPVTLTAIPTHGGTNPIYTWYRGLNSVPGDSDETITFNSPTLTDYFNVQLKTNQPCSTRSTVNANKNINVLNCTNPLKLHISGDSVLCENVQYTLAGSATGGTGGPYSFTWGTLNGQKVTANCAINCNYGWIKGKSNGTIFGVARDAQTSDTVYINVTVLPTTNSSVTLVSAPTPPCPGVLNTFTALPDSGGPNPTYKWFINYAVQSTTGPVFTSSSITAGSWVKVIMMGSTQCPDVDGDTSEIITVVPNCNNVVNLSVSRDTSVCAGEAAKISAAATGGSGNYTYKWAPATGLSCTNCASPIATLTATQTYNVSASDGQYTVVKQVKVSILPVVTDSVTITASPNPPCAGQSVAFFAVPHNGGTWPAYQWFLNGNKTNVTTSNYSKPQIYAGDKVYCRVLTPDGNCMRPATDTSNAIIAVECTGITETSLSRHISLKPNPSNGVFSMVVDATIVNFDIAVLDIQGMEIYYKTNIPADNSTLQFNFSHLAKGMYVVTLNSAQGRWMEKIVIE